jgi:hypothetical protein
LPRLDRNSLIAIVVATTAILLATANLMNGWDGFATIVPNAIGGGSEAAISLARPSYWS